MFDINFNTLFSVQLKHEFYTDKVCPDFNIIPSAETVGILAKYNMLYKQYINMLYIGMLTDNVLANPANNTVPFLAPDVNERFTFYLQNKNPLFYNFTDMPLNKLAGNILYLTNRNNNTIAGSPCLSAASAGNSVSGADLVQVTGGNFSYPLAPYLPAGTVIITDFYTNAVVSSQPFTTLPAQTLVPVDFSNLGTGKYIISVAGQASYTVYYSNEFGAGNFNGVIEIFNDPTLPAGYPLFGAGGKFASPQYIVPFLNRSTTWRYILQAGTQGTITNNSTATTFDVIGTDPLNILTSSTAIPLSQQPISLSFKYPAAPPPPTTKAIPIPTASITRLASKDPATNQYYSEIYLNY